MKKRQLTATEMAKKRWEGTTPDERKEQLAAARAKISKAGRRRAQQASVAARLAKKTAKKTRRKSNGG